MKASLQLKMGQQLAMTPQLQQAIRLLQLSTLDLQQEIQEALDSNPLLDVEEEQLSTPESLLSPEPTPEKETATAEQEDPVTDSSDVIDSNNISEELEMDASWDDVYSANSGSTGLAIDDDTPLYQGETTESLQDYLMWQADLTPLWLSNN
jgi:RNA polymerase sigma-54 factor